MYKVNKDILSNEYRKVWEDSDRMTNYCVNKVASMVTLPNGDIITVEKEKIKTRFCFGEHGFDFDDKADLARHARNSVDYLKAENMAMFNEWVNDLEECYNNGTTGKLPAYVLTIANPYSEVMNIKSLNWVRLTDVLDALGGSAYIDELAGKTINHLGHDYRIATKGEIEIILGLYKYASAQHEKKVDGYIKRYGTSKVDAWTYWADA